MRKFLAILLALTCAISVSMLAACNTEKDSDVVTKEEWETAFTNTLNSYNTAFTESFKWYYSELNSDEKTIVSEENYATALESSDGVSGKEYSYTDITYNLADGTTRGATDTGYVVYGTSSYSAVGKEVTKSNSAEDYWGHSSVLSRNISTVSACLNLDINVSYSSAEFFTDTLFNYDLYEYKDGAYVYTYEYVENGHNPYGITLGSLATCCISESVKIKINDGYVTSIVAEGVIEGWDIEEIAKSVPVDSLDYSEFLFSYFNSEALGISGKGTNTFKYELNLSDYGSTTIEIPEEYTYEYYSEHSQS